MSVQVHGHDDEGAHDDFCHLAAVIRAVDGWGLVTGSLVATYMT